MRLKSIHSVIVVVAYFWMLYINEEWWKHFTLDNQTWCPGKIEAYEDSYSCIWSASLTCVLPIANVRMRTIDLLSWMFFVYSWEPTWRKHRNFTWCHMCMVLAMDVFIPHHSPLFENVVARLSWGFSSGTISLHSLCIAKGMQHSSIIHYMNIYLIISI